MGLDAFPVDVEVHTAGGLPGFAITGLPNAVVRESKDRVRAALQNSGFDIPPSRITAHLAPADVPKDGGRFDLPIALGIIGAEKRPNWRSDDTEFIGELSLGGELRPVTGALPAVLAARDAQRRVVLPKANAVEAALVEGGRVYCAERLTDVLDDLYGVAPLEPLVSRVPPTTTAAAGDLRDVRGQATAKRALTVAAAGNHNLLMVGPPGSGKSMLAERLRGLLPPLQWNERLCVASIASVAGEGWALANNCAAPFRAPHHTTSASALVGGGPRPRPGEVSLAHLGVLFLDELPEFSRSALEALREPLESGLVRISRVRAQVTYPAQFQLVAAMNPCPCGYRGDGSDRCRCPPSRLTQYRSRISGPLLDRFDLKVEVPRVRFAELDLEPSDEASSTVAGRVAEARQRQLARAGVLNARLDDARLWQSTTLDAQTRQLLSRAAERWQLSARSTVRVLRVARTIADLDASARVDVAHLSEALKLRCLHLDPA